MLQDGRFKQWPNAGVFFPENFVASCLIFLIFNPPAEQHKLLSCKEMLRDSSTVSESRKLNLSQEIDGCSSSHLHAQQQQRDTTEEWNGNNLWEEAPCCYKSGWLSSLIKLKSAFSPFLEVPSMRINIIIIIITHSWGMCRRIQGQGEAEGIFIRHLKADGQQAHKNPSPPSFFCPRETQSCSEGEGGIPGAIAHPGWALVTAKFIGSKPLQTASKTWERGFGAAADSSMTRFCCDFGRPCPALLRMSISFHHLRDNPFPPLPASGLLHFLRSITPWTGPRL